MNTSKLFVLALALLISVASYAQKGSVTKADAYLTKKEYANAKAEIDVAITLEKAAAKSKTWFVRGKIYQEIASSTDEAVASVDPDALSKAIEAYNKVLEMDKETSPNYLLASTNLDALWGNFVNAGGEKYAEKDYASALANFESALMVRPTDSITLLYSGAAAQQADRNDLTLKYYRRMLENGDASSDVYSTLIYLERTLSKDNDAALALVRKAKDEFPKDKRFGQEEISLLLLMDKVEEARVKLEVAIESDPNNANLHLNLGVLYDNLGSARLDEGKKEEARDAYNKAKDAYKAAIEIEPDNYVGNYNTGVIYVNLAKQYLDEARDMDLKTYQKKGAPLEEKGREILKEGLPYLEKSCELDQEDIGALRALQQVYSALKMYDKAESTMEKIDAMEAGQ